MNLMNSIHELHQQALKHSHFSRCLPVPSSAVAEYRQNFLPGNVLQESILGGMEMFILCQKNNFSTVTGQHSHDFFEINYVIQGSATQRFNNEIFYLDAGDICFMDPRTMHNLYIEDDRKDIVLNIDLSKSLFDSTFLSQMNQLGELGTFFESCMLSKNYRPYLIYRNIASEEIARILQSILYEVINYPILFSRLTIQSKLISLFSEVLRENIKPKPEDFKNDIKSDVSNIIGYITENYSTVTLKSVADTFHYHPNYLSFLLKKNLHKTFAQFLKEIRMMFAINFLINTDISIKEISEKIGYDDSSSFNSAFKKTYNLTPKEYRKKHCR